MLRKRVLPILVAAIMTFGAILAAAPAHASSAPQASEVASTTQIRPVVSEEAAPASDPPGDCEFWETGVVKVGPDGYLYQCTYIWWEGWYWLPI